MKRFCLRAAARISIAMSLGIPVLMLLDARNPVMGFLTSFQARVYISVAVLFSIITAIIVLSRKG